MNGSRVAQGRDFAPDGTLRDASLTVLDEAGARGLAERLDGARFAVGAADEKPYRRRPAAPFRTATLQQEASRKLRFSAQTTMRVAQRLYESGYITYMRTDSTTLSESALAAARAQVTQLFGAEYLPEKPRVVRTRGRERAGGARGDPARGRHVPDAGPDQGRRSRATSSRSTT